MCCCKWCQYYLESIYWHCIEKHFCFDENIALYDEEEAAKSSSDTNSDTNNIQPNPTPSNGSSSRKTSNNNIYDNMAFYDNVALIANRSIFIIEPKDTCKTDGTIFTSLSRPKSAEFNQNRSLHIELFPDNCAKSKVITKQPTFTFGSDSSLDLNRSEPSLFPDSGRKVDPPKTLAQRQVEIFKSIPQINISNTQINASTSLTTISEDLEANSPNPHLLPIPHSPTSIDIVKTRKKSLHERRVSKSLTLDIDIKRQEVPIIRQSSFPKFYIDNPESNQNSSTIGTNLISALETPVPVPHAFSYDLQTVVQLEKERQELEKEKHQLRRSVTNVKDYKRIQQIRDKLKPMKLLRGTSMQSIYSSSHA